MTRPPKGAQGRYQLRSSKGSSANPFVFTEEETDKQKLIKPSPSIHKDNDEVEPTTVGYIYDVDGKRPVSEKSLPDTGVKSKSARDVELLGSSLHAPLTVQELSNGAQRKQAVKRSRSTANLNNSTSTFYIANVDALQSFYKTRLGQLPARALRKIVTQWIAIIRPRRRTYGRYSKKQFPSELRKDQCPPWWPKDVYYEDPFHLERDCTHIMLLHRHTNNETGERRVDWIQGLGAVADHIIDVSSRNGLSAALKSRALNTLSDLLDTAQSHENHVATYELYDDKVNEDPESLRGKKHTWALIPSLQHTPGENKRPRFESDSASAVQSRPPSRMSSIPQSRVIRDLETPAQRHLTAPLPAAQQQVSGPAPSSLLTLVAAYPAAITPPSTFQNFEIPVSQPFHELSVPLPYSDMNNLQSLQESVQNPMMLEWPAANHYIFQTSMHQMPQQWEDLEFNGQ
ncbi:hypothetical protein BU24DRAFT_459920 [Aaosphaeria arxii CBS 175.79]|uniref:Subtelomeric hrmA-associated cluster protein AFUB-079030/YDR124W-like helical bundle domain-containing protein n=1 Tax=Aaosphaeria arxii CBS 175.79 TaxID=1450172 RepID=A0A6A5Y4A0_9PLEO|nr:uncharacterized protein BU24DRAFT_459920 [Aaosphaeria arxii CBS 175.79]KAF2020328.1 hypothetical protein BU24DRAFT_459920 [Aaosphaeria arxii CBS 175.79]